jgi:hypothetical protein
MEENRGARTIFFIFWVIGSIFWFMIAVISGDIKQSVIHIAIGWAVLYGFFMISDFLKKDKSID